MGTQKPVATTTIRRRPAAVDGVDGGHQVEGVEDAVDGRRDAQADHHLALAHLKEVQSLNFRGGRRRNRPVDISYHFLARLQLLRSGLRLVLLNL